MEVGRGLITEKIDEEFVGYTISLDNHIRTTVKLLRSLFNTSDYLTTATELHDKYKLVTMRVWESESGRYVVGFEGHPYKLSFTDFEGLFSKYDGRERTLYIGLATAIARLHHFINIRDVDTFIHTLAITKAYLSTHGVYIGLDELRQKVLDGVVLLHIADMLAGYIEQALLEGSSGRLISDVELIDTSDVKHGIIEPHIPAHVDVSIEGKELKVKVILHGLLHIINHNLLSKPVRLEFRYDVYRGKFTKGGRIFNSESKDEYLVKMLLLHKRVLYGI